MSLRHLATTIFDAGKLKPKYLFKNCSFYKNPEYSFKRNNLFLKIQNIHSKQIFIFLKIQNIHSNKILIFSKSRIFIQTKYSFFKKGRIEQGYPWINVRPCRKLHTQSNEKL